MMKHFFGPIQPCLAVVVMLLGCSFGQAKENTYNWTAESKFEYAVKFLDKLKERFERRAALVDQEGGSKLVYSQENLVEVLGEPGSRRWEEFESNDLSRSRGEKALFAYAKDLEFFRRKLVEEEKKLAAVWKPEKEAEVAKTRVVEVFGENISSSRIGVILDNSPSMSPYLDKVRAAIQQRFSYEYVVEVDGSYLWSYSSRALGREFSEPPSRGFFYEEPAAGINPFTPDRFIVSVPGENWHQHFRQGEQDNMAAMWTMVKLMKVDTIYWFCDLDDETYEHAIATLGKLLKEGKTKLFVHTLDKNPDRALLKVIEDSGGKLIRERIR